MLDKNRLLNSDLALHGIFICVAALMGYLESLIPFAFPVPGIRLGLANIVIIWVLYTLGLRSALIVSLLRCLIIGLLFGNIYSIMFSIAGAFSSLIVMFLLKKYAPGKFSVMGVSVCGAIVHNIAQVIVAMIVIKNAYIITYLPVLIGVGVISGIVIGLLGGLLYKKIKLVPAN